PTVVQKAETDRVPFWTNRITIAFTAVWPILALPAGLLLGIAHLQPRIWLLTHAPMFGIAVLTAPVLTFSLLSSRFPNQWPKGLAFAIVIVPPLVVFEYWFAATCYWIGYSIGMGSAP